MDKQISEHLRKLERGDEDEIAAAAEKMEEMAKQVVELPPKKVARILQALLDARDKTDFDALVKVIGAIDKVIYELTVKYDIIIGPDTTVAYEWYVGLLNEMADHANQ